MSQHKQSRKHVTRKVQPERQSFKWLWVAGIGIVVIIIGVLLFQANRASSQNSAAIQVKGSPRLSVVQDTFDYGDVQLGTTVQTVFRVRNVGDQPLVILNQPRVQVVEGCCPPEAILSSSTIQPGQEATISLSFMMHGGLMGGQSMAGKHRFNINLQTNDPTESNRLLVVLSNWI